MAAIEDFLPLKSYKKAIILTLIVSLSLTLVLGLHLYHLKLDRHYEHKVRHFTSVSQHIEQNISSLEYFFNITRHSINSTQTKPELPGDWQSKLTKEKGFYYGSLDEGESHLLVPSKVFSASPNIEVDLKRVHMFQQAFESSLSLFTVIHGVAYVNKEGMSMLKVRNGERSALHKAISNGKLSPGSPTDSMQAFGPINTVEGRFFSVAFPINQKSGEYILFIYERAEFSYWLQFISKMPGTLAIYSQDGQLLAFDKQVESEDTLENMMLLPQKGGLMLKDETSSPIATWRYVESEHTYTWGILKEVIIEFSLIACFIFSTFLVLVWLNKQIFITPIRHFINYITLQDDAPNSTFEYSVPREWQPWFLRMKQVIADKNRYLAQLRTKNQALDEQVQSQQRALLRTIESKDRQAALLNAVLDTAPDLIFFKNIDGSFIGCNKAFEAFIGVEKALLVAREHHEVTNDYHELLTLEQEMYRGNCSISQTLQLDNDTFWLTISPLYNEQGNLIGSLGVARDISEQQHAYMALRDSEAKFKAAIEYAPSGVMLLDPEEKVLAVNRAAKRFLNSNNNQEATLKGLFSEDNYSEIESALSGLKSGVKSRTELVFSQSSSVSWLQVGISIVWGSENQAQYFVLHLQDITQITQARLEAERATLAKSRFIANISHEIRTPLNAILGLSEMTKSESLSVQQHTHLTQLQFAANELLDMLNNILEFSKIESHHSEVEIAPFKISHIVDDIERLIDPLCKQKGLSFDISVDKQVWPELSSDINKIKQVLINLLSNAVKYTKTGFVKLDISHKHDDGKGQWLTFSVIDSGVGIKPQDKKFLFDAFTQGDESLTREHQGIGLGLAIAKQEINLLDGSISVNSEYQKGSCFFFTIRVEKVGDILKLPEFLVTEQENTLPLYFSNTNAYKDQVVVISSGGQEQHVDAVKKYVPSSVGQTEKGALLVYHIAFWQRVYEDLVGTHQEQKSTDLRSGGLYLVVDDNEVNLDIARNTFEQFGLNVVTAISAAEIDTLCESLRPDAVFMDIHMPVIDGYQATTLLRKLFDKEALPIIALTANVSSEQKVKTQEYGMNAFLAKPLNANELMQTLISIPENTPAFFDSAFALEQLMNNEAFLEKMLLKFASLCSDYIVSLDDETDNKHIKALAHSIKGAAAGLGFKRLAQIAKEVEKNEDDTKLPELITSLSMQLKQVSTFIRLNT